jgi:hypothetical protein
MWLREVVQGRERRFECKLKIRTRVFLIPELAVGKTRGASAYLATISGTDEVDLIRACP